MAERTRCDRTGGRARRGVAGQRLLHRRAGDRIQGHGVRTPGRRHEGRLRRADRSAAQSVLGALVCAQQRGARDRGQHRPGCDARRGARALRRHPRKGDSGAPERALPAAQAHGHSPRDHARVPAGSGRFPFARTRESGLSRFVRAAGDSGRGSRRAAPTRRRRYSPRGRVDVDALLPRSAGRFCHRRARARQRSRCDGQTARNDHDELPRPWRAGGTLRLRPSAG